MYYPISWHVMNQTRKSSTNLCKESPYALLLHFCFVYDIVVVVPNHFISLLLFIGTPTKICMDIYSVRHVQQQMYWFHHHLRITLTITFSHMTLHGKNLETRYFIRLDPTNFFQSKLTSDDHDAWNRQLKYLYKTRLIWFSVH